MMEKAGQWRGNGDIGGMHTGGQEMMGHEEGLLRATETLRLMSHPGRLRALCHLLGEGELTAGALSERVGLSPSALSQHLALLRAEGFVSTRKEAQTVYYRLERKDVTALIELLHRLYCR